MFIFIISIIRATYQSMCWSCVTLIHKRIKNHRARAASGGPCASTRRAGRERRGEESRSERGGGEGWKDMLVKMMATDAEEIRNQTSPRPIPDNSLSTLSIKITRKNQDRHWKLRFIYLQCCEYRHTSRRSESHTGTGHTSPLRIYRNMKLPLFYWPTFGFSQQHTLFGQASLRVVEAGWGR